MGFFLDIVVDDNTDGDDNNDVEEEEEEEEEERDVVDDLFILSSRRRRINAIITITITTIIIPIPVTIHHPLHQNLRPLQITNLIKPFIIILQVLILFFPIDVSRYATNAKSTRLVST